MIMTSPENALPPSQIERTILTTYSTKQGKQKQLQIKAVNLLLYLFKIIGFSTSQNHLKSRVPKSEWLSCDTRRDNVAVA
jgi:hypothetical protein